MLDFPLCPCYNQPKYKQKRRMIGLMDSCDGDCSNNTFLIVVGIPAPIFRE